MVLNRGTHGPLGVHVTFPGAKHKKLGVHNDILGVHEENQLRTFFIFENLIYTVIYCSLSLCSLPNTLSTLSCKENECKSE